MRNRIFLLLLPLSTLFLLSACLPGIPPEKAPPIHYYTLDYEPRLPNRETLPHVLDIRAFAQGPHCNTDKMVYSQEENSREEYHYHRWRSSPADLATYFLRRDLRQGKIFTAVTGPSFGQSCTHRLEGIVEEFYQMDKNGSSYAVAQINVTLLKCNERDISDRVVMQKMYRIRKKMPGKNPGGLAKAMSEVMAQFSRQLAGDMYRVLE